MLIWCADLGMFVDNYALFANLDVLLYNIQGCLIVQHPRGSLCPIEENPKNIFDATTMLTRIMENKLEVYWIEWEVSVV